MQYSPEIQAAQATVRDVFMPALSRIGEDLPIPFHSAARFSWKETRHISQKYLSIAFDDRGIEEVYWFVKNAISILVELEQGLDGEDPAKLDGFDFGWVRDARIALQGALPMFNPEIRYRQQSEALSELQTKTATAMADVQAALESFQATQSQLAAKSDVALAYLESRKAKADELIGDTGIKTIAGNYETHANKEASAAMYTRLACIACMLTASCLAVSALVHSNTPPPWHEYLGRLFAAAILSLPAAYFARESTRHRQQQHSYRRQALVLKATSPILAGLPETRQDEINAEIISKLFSSAQTQYPVESSYPVDFNAVLVTLAGGKKDAKDVGKP